MDLDKVVSVCVSARACASVCVHACACDGSEDEVGNTPNGLSELCL